MLGQVTREQHDLINTFFRQNTDYFSEVFNDQYASRIFPYLCNIIAENNPIYVDFLSCIYFSVQHYSSFYQIHNETFIEGILETLVRLESLPHYISIRNRNVQECFARDPITGDRLHDNNGALISGMADDHPQFFLEMYQCTNRNWFSRDLERIVRMIRATDIETVDLDPEIINAYRPYWHKIHADIPEYIRGIPAIMDDELNELVQPDADNDPVEDHVPVADHEPAEDHEPVADHEPAEDHAPVADHEPTEEEEDRITVADDIVVTYSIGDVSVIRYYDDDEYDRNMI
jgi:hypothetical protein